MVQPQSIIANRSDHASQASGKGITFPAQAINNGAAMFNAGSDKIRDPAILVARLLLALLFIIFGWKKLTGFSGTVVYMAATGAPAPELSAIIAIIMEFFAGLAIILGLATRPLALLLLLYTLATAIIGHHYWTMTGMEQFEAMINFYKNVSIMGGLLLLYVTGAGKYSVDAKLGWA
jgi:putative oxidoreductase